LQHPTRFILFGILFSIFWSSASVAGKFGLMSAEPLTLFTSRFISAGLLLLTLSLFQKGRKLPENKEWIQLVIFGALNTTLYLGIFIIALKEVAAGITTLMLALNPLMISVITSLWLKRKIAPREWGSISLGIVGVCVATFPLVQSGHASVFGIVLLVFSMLAYSVAAVYYSSVSWSLSRMTINGWQVLIGGILLLPFYLRV
jgi:drug/metabolite transporter (DMT)-like permease